MMNINITKTILLLLVMTSCLTDPSSEETKFTIERTEHESEETKNTDRRQNRSNFSRSEIINPIIKNEFRSAGCAQRKQGGNPKMVNGYFQFDGSLDGNRQVDPQIAIGNGYILHGTNSGLIIYDKQGNFIDGVSQSCFNKGIDPKIFYDAHNKVFGFDLWNPWDSARKKPINIAISQTNDPTKGWNIYPVPAPAGVDGGGIGYSKKWLGYTFPGGTENTIVMKMSEIISGKPATAYYFKGFFGQPIFSQDNIDDLYFLKISGSNFVITKVTEGANGKPTSQIVSNKRHNLTHVGYPPQSPQKGTTQKTSSGDRNPKNLVLNNNHIWFSHAINYNNRSAVQWHQITLDGTIVQTGLIYDKNTNYIQTTIAVNSKDDVLIGFQETNSNMYISPRFTYRKSSDPLGTTREIVSLGEGKGHTSGTSWGDYSGSAVDDNCVDLWTIQSITDQGGKGDTVIAKWEY